MKLNGDFMKINKLIIIALILFALICLPISFASESDFDSICDASLESESINQINSNVNLEDNLELDDSCLNDGYVDDIDSDLNYEGIDSNSNNENMENVDSEGYNIADHNLKDENAVDYNSPNLNTNFTNLNVTFTDSNTIFVNASYLGSVESGTRDNPYKTLIAAYNNFTSSSNTKTNIFLANGIYTVNSIMTISKNLNLIGESTLNTIIRSNDIYQILKITPPRTYGAVSPFVNIFNLTFTKGHADYGGAIYINESGANIVNVNFVNNTAGDKESLAISGSGGAIYIDKAFVKFYNTSFIGNKAIGSEDAYGGALINDMGEITIINCNFTNNSVVAGNGAGGAIYDYSGITVLFNSTVSYNAVNSSLSMGGGIANWASHNVYIINSTIDNNNLFGDYTFGSAIINKANYLIIANTTISNNSAMGISDTNGTFLNLNGIVNSSNLLFENNRALNPQENLFLCLEDQLILERPFDDALLTDLPSQYNLNDYGLINPIIKDQAGAGACWTFATLEALESYLLKSENISYDFSENNMKNLMGVYGLNGTDWSDGGNHFMSLAYLLRWSGPINETQDPYNDIGHASPSNLKPIRLVQDALFIPVRLNYLDINQIKAAIMTYGALYTTIHSDSTFQYTPDYYLDVITVSNHAITLVGWDDNYSADHFAVKPPGDGAFIIKNSWGDEWGYDGYWYISYYDKSFAGYGRDTISAMAFTNVENATAYKTNYQYDILGNTFESIGFGCSTAWFANQFTAKNNNPLSAFGLYTYGDSSYLVNITVNGVVKCIQEGQIKGAGYHTVKLDEFVELTKDDVFRVAVKLTTPISLFPVAIEAQRSGYSSGADAEEGQSFISSDGIEWHDLADYNDVIKFYQFAQNYTLEKANVCLKAYASGYADVFLNIKSNTSIYYKGDTMEITLFITNEGDSINDVDIKVILDKNVTIKSFTPVKGTFNLNTKVWHLSSLNQDESVSLKLILSLKGIKDIVTTSFDFNYSGFIPSNFNTSVSLDTYYAGFTSIVQLENISTIAKSQDNVLIRLLDWNSTPLSNKAIVISLLEVETNGESNQIIQNGFVPISLVTDEDGNAEFTLDLLEGNYKFLASFDDDRLDSSNMTFNVSVSRINTEIKVLGDLNLSNITTFVKSNDEIIFHLIDENSNVIKDKAIRLTVNELDQVAGGNGGFNQVIDLMSDEEGFYRFNLNLIAGTYNFNLDFLGDDVYNKSALSFNVNVIKKASPIISIENNLLNVYDNLRISLTDENGDFLANKILKVTITNSRCGKNTLLTLTDENGIVEFFNMIEGTYNISIRFENDELYGDSVLDDSFSVIKEETQIICSEMNTTAFDAKTDKKTTAYFIWRLVDSKGNPIANAPMQIGFNGVVYTYEKNGICTDEEGYAKLPIGLGYKGTYTFAICFLGDEKHKASFAVTKINVAAQKGSLVVPNKSYKVSTKTKALTATFKSASGKPVAGKKVTFTVNGKNYSAKTNEKGVATVNVSITKKGTYKVTAKFETDQMYESMAKTAKLTIK